MPTVTFRLDESTDARLKRQLAHSGKTLSDFIREALAKHLDAVPTSETRLGSLKRVLEAMGDDSRTDLSTTYKTRLRKKLEARRRS